MEILTREHKRRPQCLNPFSLKMGFQATVAVLATVTLLAVADEIKCKNGSPFVKDDPCEFVRKGLTRHAKQDFGFLSEYVAGEDGLLKSVVFVAEKNDDKSYTVKALGVAVAEKYFLTSVTSNFKKYRTDDDLYIIHEGSKVYNIRSANFHPEIFIGAFNKSAWQDLALVKIPDESTLKFDYTPIIREPMPYRTTYTLKKKCIAVDSLRIFTHNSWLSSRPMGGFAWCKIQSEKGPLVYWKWAEYSEYTACVTEWNIPLGKDTDFLSGVPQGYSEKNGKFTLYGIRSLESFDPTDKDAHLITLIGPHCGWLSSVSNGAVKCSPPLLPPRASQDRRK